MLTNSYLKKFRDDRDDDKIDDKLFVKCLAKIVSVKLDK